jgi:hypothetical protein
MRGQPRAILLHSSPHINRSLRQAMPLNEREERGIDCVVGWLEAAAERMGTADV